MCCHRGVTTPSRPWLTETEEATWRSWLFAHERLLTQMQDGFRASGLSTPEYSILVFLTDSPEGLTMKQLRGLTRWERSRLSHQVTRMVTRGLVTQTKAAGKGGASIVRITAVGERTIQAAAPAHLELVREQFFDRLTPEEVETLGAIAAKLAK